MKLRRLELKDAPFMFEWMHDKEVVSNMLSDFSSKTINDCIEFIKKSITSNSINLAIVSDNDEYMGTVSLKHIDRIESSAEFAIAIRGAAMGRGYSWYGMKEIIKYAFEKENIDTIYWCVYKKNKRACRFYEKHNFKELLDVSDKLLCHYPNIDGLKWYIINKEDKYLFDSEHIKEIVGCKIINIKTIATEKAGQLSFFEAKRDFPFEVKRLYYISKVPEGVRRGFHAHKKLKQLIFCPYGQINLVLDNGSKREEILLDKPSIEIIIDKPIWREMVWIQKDSILCCAASDYYT